MRPIKTAAIVMSGILLFAGCGKPQSVTPPEMAAVTMGRYVEKEIPELEAPYVVQQKPDGSIDFLMINQENNGSELLSWKAGEVSPSAQNWMSPPEEISISLDDSACDKEGNYYLFGTDYSEYKTTRKLSHRLYRLENETPVEVPIQWQEISSSTGNKILIADNGDLLVNFGMGGVFQYDMKTGAKKNEFSGKWWYDMATAGTKLYVSEYETSSIICYNLDTGEQESDMTPEGLRHEGASLTTDSSGTLFACDNSGLSKWDEAQSKWEQLIDGELNLMSMNAMHKQDFIANTDGGFFVVYNQDGKTGATAHYSYDANVPSRPLEVLTITSMKANVTLQAAIREMRNQNPDLFVKYRVMIDGDSGVSEADTIKAVNTELLSGKGDDIYLLDSFPIDSYIEKGVLMDISSLVDPLCQDGLLYENIANTYSDPDSGKLYAVPVRFRAPMMWASTEMLEQVKDISTLADWAEQHPDLPIISTMSPQGLLSRFYSVCAPAWLSKENGIDPKGMAVYLESIKRISQTAIPLESTFQSITQYYEEWDYAKTWEGSFSPEMLQRKANECHMIVDAPSSMDYFRGNQYALNQSGAGGSFTSQAGQVENVYIPSSIVGINSGSSHVEAAKEFIAILLSELVQTQVLGDGLPIRPAVLESNLKKESSQGIDYALGGSSLLTGENLFMSLRDDESWLTPNECEKAKTYFNALNTPSSIDWNILDLITKEAIPYFEGTRSLDETTAAIVSRSEAYLAE